MSISPGAATQNLLPRLMDPRWTLFMVTTPVLGDIELGHHNNAPNVISVALRSRNGGCLHVLQLDIVHHTLLALGKSHVGERICPLWAMCRSTATAARVVTTAATNAPEAFWGLVLLVCAARRAAEQWPEPGPEERKHHGEVGGDDGDEGFACPPCAGELGAIDAVL